MTISDLTKSGILIGGIVSGWLFLDSYFVSASAMEQTAGKLNETLILLQIDLAEDKLYRLRLDGINTNEQIAKEKQLEKRLDRLEHQLDKD